MSSRIRIPVLLSIFGISLCLFAMYSLRLLRNVCVFCCVYDSNHVYILLLTCEGCSADMYILSLLLLLCIGHMHAIISFLRLFGVMWNYS
jgi:hypothetical protein